MKTTRVFLLTMLFHISAHAQVLVAGGGNQTETLTELSAVPSSGTFWSASRKLPPWPVDPLPQLPIYGYGPASNQVYIFDDRNWDYSANNSGMFPMDGSDPPSPGGTNSDGGGNGGPILPAQDFTTNDLWLEIDGVTNGTALLVIHPPWDVTNGVYDLYYTTNLSPPISWQWIMRSAPGQTNLAPTNATGTQGFYRIGFADSSSGTDFWVTFPNAGGLPPYYASLSLYICSPLEASGTVSIPGLQFTQAFSVTSGGVTNISIINTAFLYQAGIASNGIHFTATQPVSVYGGCLADDYDRYAFTAYPTAALGTNYCLMAHPGDSGGDSSQFAIVATSNNTTIMITPSTNAYLSNSETNTYPVILQQGETYAAQSSSASGDVTGTLIISDAPIAVFAGADAAVVSALIDNPLGQEQLPVADWGVQALALSFAGRTGGDAYRVLALSNNTVVRTNGIVAQTLRAGQFYDTIVKGSVQFQGSNPIQVAHFANGEGYDNPPGNQGSDTEILLPATGRYSPSYIVYSIPFAENFVNLVVATNATLTTLDGTNINLLTTNFPSIGSSGYFGVRIPVLPGPHTISSSLPAQVEVYGFQYYSAYGYAGGALSAP